MQTHIYHTVNNTGKISTNYFTY